MMYNKIFSKQPTESNESLGFLPQKNFNVFPQFFRNQHELLNFHANQLQGQENSEYNMNIIRQNMDFLKNGQGNLQAFPTYINLKTLSNTMYTMFNETKIESEVSPSVCKIEQGLIRLHTNKFTFKLEASLSIKTEESEDFHKLPSGTCHNQTTNLKIEDKLDQEDYEHRSINHRKQRNYWLENEDEALISLVDKYGEKWSKVASYMAGRTGKQVRDRYLNYLRPNINQKDWTPEEDNLLKDLYDELGNKWSRIAVYLQGRTENQVKNRFYAAIRKEKRKIKKSKIFCKAEPELMKQVKFDASSPSNFPTSPSTAANKLDRSESQEFYPLQNTIPKPENNMVPNDFTKFNNQFGPSQMGYNRAMYGQMVSTLLQQQMYQRFLGTCGKNPSVLQSGSENICPNQMTNQKNSKMIKHEA